MTFVTAAFLGNTMISSILWAALVVATMAGWAVYGFRRGYHVAKTEMRERCQAGEVLVVVGPLPDRSQSPQ